MSNAYQFPCCVCLSSVFFLYQRGTEIFIFKAQLTCVLMMPIERKRFSCSTQQEDAQGWPAISSLRLVSSADAWDRAEFGKIYLLANLSDLSVFICSYFVSDIYDFLTFEMWEGIFCTFHVESNDFIPWKIWHKNIISHSCQLGDKVCRNKGKSPVSRFTILGFHGNIFFVIFIRDAIFQFF